MLVKILAAHIEAHQSLQGGRRVIALDREFQRFFELSNGFTLLPLLEISITCIAMHERRIQSIGRKIVTLECKVQISC